MSVIIEYFSMGSIGTDTRHHARIIVTGFHVDRLIDVHACIIVTGFHADGLIDVIYQYISMKTCYNNACMVTCICTYHVHCFT